MLPSWWTSLSSSQSTTKFPCEFPLRKKVKFTERCSIVFCFASATSHGMRWMQGTFPVAVFLFRPRSSPPHKCPKVKRSVRGEPKRIESGGCATKKKTKRKATAAEERRGGDGGGGVALPDGAESHSAAAAAAAAASDGCGSSWRRRATRRRWTPIRRSGSRRRRRSWRPASPWRRDRTGVAPRATTKRQKELEKTRAERP